MRFHFVCTFFGVLLYGALFSNTSTIPIGQNNGDHVILNPFTSIQAGINNPLGLDFTKGKLISCFGGSDGEMTAEGFNGLPPYTFSWSDGQTGPTATGLSAGTYTVTVTDSNGDMSQLDITFSQPTEVILSVVSETYIPCISPHSGSQRRNSGNTYLWSTGTTGPTGLNNTDNSRSH